MREPRWPTGLCRSLRPPRPLPPPQRRLLVLLGTAFVLNNYDFGLLSLALPQIQAELAIAEHQVGAMNAVVRLGVLPAMFLAMVADRHGRRRLLLFTIVGFSACTLLTALARTPTQFIAVQFLSRAFTSAEETLAMVVITEELDAEARGWGIGVLAALGGLGHGLASVMYALIDTLPYGWRALYVCGATPLLLLAWLRRRLPETRRFELYRDRHAGAAALAGVFNPVGELVRAYPGRVLALGAALAPFWFVMSTTLVFMSKFLQQTHGYTARTVALLFLAGGSIAILGNIAGGKMSDRFGRRAVLVTTLLANAASIAFFYNGPRAGVAPAWIVVVFTFFTVDVVFAALGSELFPTSHRSTASAVRSVIATGGAVSGLAFEGVLFGWTGTHAAAITWMLSTCLIAPAVVACCIPETARRSLEEIAPDRPAVHSSLPLAQTRDTGSS